MDEQNTSAPTSPSSNKTIPIVVGVVIVLAVGWYFTRGVGMPYGVNMDRNMDGSATYSNDQGSVTVGTQTYPDNWPSDAPKYANGQVQYSASSDQQTGGKGSMVMFTTSDSPQTVSAFYKKELPVQGWKIEQTATINQMTVISGTKETMTFSVQIAVGDNNQTTVTAVVANN